MSAKPLIVLHAQGAPLSSNMARVLLAKVMAVQDFQPDQVRAETYWEIHPIQGLRTVEVGSGAMFLNEVVDGEKTHGFTLCNVAVSEDSTVPESSIILKRMSTGETLGVIDGLQVPEV